MQRSSPNLTVATSLILSALSVSMTASDDSHYVPFVTQGTSSEVSDLRVNISASSNNSLHFTPHDKFLQLATLWFERIWMHSNLDFAGEDDAFKEIVNLGQSVIPFILEEISKAPAHWMLVLHEITGIRMNGDMQSAVDDWIEWGKRNEVHSEIFA